MVCLKPFLSFNKCIMTKLFQDFKGSSANLFGQFLCIMDDNFGLSGNHGHDISHDDLDLSLDWGHDFIDFVFELVKFFRDLVREVLSSLLDFINGVVNSLSNLAPEVCPAIVRDQRVFDKFGKLFSQEFEEQLLNKLMVLIEPLLGFDQSIMTQLFQDLKSGRANLLGEFTSIMNNDFGLGSNLGHDISQDDLNLGFDGGDNGVDLIFELIKFFRDFVSQFLASSFDFVNSIFNGIANFFPEISPSIVRLN